MPPDKDSDKYYWGTGFTRVFGLKLKHGFWLMVGEDRTGEFTDKDFLTEMPDKKIIIKRMIDTKENNGFWLKEIDPRPQSLLRTIFHTELTGGIFDEALEESKMDAGDVARITITPRGENKFRLNVEYKWEDQVVEE